MDAQGNVERMESGATETSDTVRPFDRHAPGHASHQPHRQAVGKPEPAPKGGAKRKAVLPILALAVLGLGGHYGYRWWIHDRFFITTDDAYVAADITQIAAKVSGYVATMDVQANQRITAGDIIARIDDGDYRLAVRTARNKLDSQNATIARIERQIAAARAGVGQAQAQVESARASLTRASADFERQSSLTASRVGSAAQLDAARAARDTAAAAVRSADATLNQSQANVAVYEAQKVEAENARAELETAIDKAERDLSFTVIRAPVDGTIGARAVEVGAYVQPGTRITALIADGGLHIDANFKETQIDGIHPDSPVEIMVDAYPDRALEGRVVSLSPATGATFSLLPPENATGNFTKIVQRVPVRVAVSDKDVADGLLRAGLSVLVGVDKRGRP